MKTFLFLACFITVPALAASGVMLKNEDLRASASASATSVGRLDKGATVEVLGRQGGWTQVSEGGRKGWVRILSLRSTDTSGSSAGLAGLVEAGSKRSDSSRVVAVAGLRGLNEEELKSARFDANELMNLDRYQVDRAAAEQYARAVGLRHQDLGYLPAPQREQGQDKGQSSPWGEGGGL
ncbi:MAG: SH3 domain-containing protein [Pseudomonadota bacterium]|nr:SH3 domain-containing protein [Pseudomonadota bacterium]